MIHDARSIDPLILPTPYNAFLEAARKAKLHIINPSNDSSQPSASATTPVVAEPTLQAVNELANKFNQHMALMDQRLSQQEAQLNAISRQPPAQSNYHTFNNRYRLRRAPHRGPGNEQAPLKTTNANTAVSSNTGEITCYKCGFPNHIARNCTQKKLDKASEPLSSDAWNLSTDSADSVCANELSGNFKSHFLQESPDL